MGHVTAGETVLGYVRAAVEVVLDGEEDVRADAPGAVHAARVASRRLRSTLRTFRPLLDRERTEPLRDELRWFAAVLGQARDAEVTLAAADSLLAGDGHGAERAGLDNALEARHREARTAVVRALDGVRYARLRGELRTLAADPLLTVRALRPATDELPRLVRKADKRVRRRHRAAEAAASPEECAELLHEVRKAAKRARYAAEAAAPAVGKDARRYARRMKALQEVLGTQQDAALLTETAAGLPESPLAAELRTRAADRATPAPDELAEAWRRATRKKHRRWMR